MIDIGVGGTGIAAYNPLLRKESPSSRSAESFFL